MTKKLSDAALRRLRNEIGVINVVHALQIPWRLDDTKFRFICPSCNGLDTSIHPEVNLARCFTCGVNRNPIDLVMIGKQLKFRMAVEYLQTLDKMLADPDAQRLMRIQARRSMLK